MFSHFALNTVKSLSLAQMKSKSSYTSFDFNNYWKMNSKSIFPVLSQIKNYLTYNKSISENKNGNKLLYDSIFIGLTTDRDILYDRINKRVDMMMEEGLEEEVAYIVENASANTTALQAIGYKEFIPYFHGEHSLEQVIEEIKKKRRAFQNEKDSALLRCVIRIYEPADL